MTDDAIHPASLGLKMGLLAGIACVAYLSLLYLAGGSMLFSLWVLLVFLIIVIFKIADAYILWKKRNNNVSFREALRSLFVVSVVSLLMVTIFYYLMINQVDSSILQPVKDRIAGKAAQAFEQGKITGAQLSESKKRIENMSFSAGLASMVYSMLLFIGFFYSLVFAGVIRLISKDVAARVSGSN